MTPEMYNKFLRVLGAGMAIVFWAVSMNFSYDGFDISVPGMSWVGVVLAIGVTVVELIWNKQGMNGNLTLVAAGLLCYVYGMYTNVAGILYAQGLTMDTVLATPENILFPLILGMFLEVVPEPLLVWGLVGVTDGGDLLGNLFGSVKASVQPQVQKQQPPVNQQANKPVIQQHKPGQPGKNRPIQHRPTWPTDIRK